MIDTRADAIRLMRKFNKVVEIYQDNIQKAKHIPSEILIGLKQGTPLIQLFEQSCFLYLAVSGNTVWYNSIKEELSKMQE